MSAINGAMTVLQTHLLRKLVDQNSYTMNIAGVNAVQDTLENYFLLIGMATRRIPVAGRGDMLIAETSPTSEPRILLAGHADTVHPEGSYPGEFAEDDTYYYGPGVYDMKAGLVELLLILEEFHSAGRLDPIPLRVIINPAEENPNDESIRALLEASAGSGCCLLFESGREHGIVTERKGITEITIQSRGRAAHAGNQFFEGKNAILMLQPVISYCASLTDRDADLTVNVATVSGGLYFSIVPDSAVLSVEIRGPSTRLMEEAAADIGRFCESIEGVSAEVGSRIPPLHKGASVDPMIVSFQRIASSMDWNAAELPRVGGTSDANFLSGAGIPCLDALGPLGGGAHTVNERVLKASLPHRASVVARFILEYSGLAA